MLTPLVTPCCNTYLCGTRAVRRGTLQPFPPVPDVTDAPADLFEGHLWILEKVDGAPLRFQLRESGLLRFGDGTRTYDDPADVPLPYQHAVRHVREHLDRESLRKALPDVTAATFYGEATHKQTIDYDWERLPSFLGFEVWSAGREEFLPPDAVATIFEQVNLRPVNAVERELPARDFDPTSYPVPDSAWYDGPAEGVVIRDKRGHRAQLTNPGLVADDSPPPSASSGDSVSELAASLATPERFSAVASRLDDEGQPVTFDTLFERVIESIVREEHATLFEGHTAVDPSQFRAAIAPLTRSFLEDRER